MAIHCTLDRNCQETPRLENRKLAGAEPGGDRGSRPGPRQKASTRSDDDRHVLPSEKAVRKKLLAVFLDFGEQSVVMVGIMVGQDQFFDSGKPGAFDGLLIAGMAPTAVADEFLRGELRIVEEKIGPAAELDRGRVESFAVLDVGANHDGFPTPDDTIAVSAPGMPVFLRGHDGFWEGTDGRVGEQEFEIGSHIAQLHGEILVLHWYGENPFQVRDRSLATQREERDLLSFDVGGFEKWQALNVVPVEVGKRDDYGLLPEILVLHDLLTEAPYSCAGIDNPDIYRVVRGDEDAAGAPPELVVLGPADRNGAAASVNHHPDLVVTVRFHFRFSSSVSP